MSKKVGRSSEIIKLRYLLRCIRRLMHPNWCIDRWERRGRCHLIDRKMEKKRNLKNKWKTKLKFIVPRRIRALQRDAINRRQWDRKVPGAHKINFIVLRRY